MADDGLIEIHRQHRSGQDKYTYFLLAITASVVAFSVQKTSGLKLVWPMLPLGFAVLFWGISFYFGCKSLIWVQTSIYANYSLLQLHKGVHPEQPDHPSNVSRGNQWCTFCDRVQHKKCPVLCGSGNSVY